MLSFYTNSFFEKLDFNNKLKNENKFETKIKNKLLRKEINYINKNFLSSNKSDNHNNNKIIKNKIYNTSLPIRKSIFYF